MGEAKGYGEPWQACDGNRWVVRDVSGATVARCHDDTKASTVTASEMAARVAACVSFLAGIPTARLTPSDPVACMLLACLRGADREAACYADEVVARASAPDGFVPRAELEREVAALKGRVGGLRKLLRHIWAVINTPHINPPDPPYRGSDSRWQNERDALGVVYLRGVIDDLLDRIDEAGVRGHEAKAEVPGDA